MLKQKLENNASKIVEQIWLDLWSERSKGPKVAEKQPLYYQTDVKLKYT